MTLKSNTLYLLLLTIIASIAFYNLSTYHFWDGWDDRDHFDAAVKMVHDITYLWNPDRIAPFRPPVDVYWVVGYLLGGDPVTYRMMQVALHVLVAFLVAQVAYQQLDIPRFVAYGAGILFLINVSHFRAVHWPTVTTYVLCALFSLLSVYLCGFDSRKKTWLGISLIPLAILSHPAGIFIVLVLLFMFWDASLWDKEKRRWYFYAPVLLGAVSLVLAIVITPNGGQNAGGLSTFNPETLINPLWYLGAMISMTFWPIPSMVINVPNIWAIGVGVAAIGAVVFCWRVVWSADWLIWVVWIACAFLPYLNHPWVLLGFGPTRQLYIASVGWCILMALVLWHFCVSVYDTHRSRVYVFCVMVGLISCVSVFGLRKAEALTLYISGRGYQYHGDDAKATSLYRQAIDTGWDLLPDDVYVRLALSASIQGEDSVEDLVQGYDRTGNLEIPGYIGIVDLFGSEYSLPMVKEGAQKVGTMAYRQSLASLAYNCGMWQIRAKDYEKARTYLRLATNIEPEHERAATLLRLLEKEHFSDTP